VELLLFELRGRTVVDLFEELPLSAFVDRPDVEVEVLRLGVTAEPFLPLPSTARFVVAVVVRPSPFEDVVRLLEVALVEPR